MELSSCLAAEGADMSVDSFASDVRELHGSTGCEALTSGYRWFGERNCRGFMGIALTYRYD